MSTEKRLRANDNAYKQPVNWREQPADVFGSFSNKALCNPKQPAQPEPTKRSNIICPSCGAAADTEELLGHGPDCGATEPGDRMQEPAQTEPRPMIHDPRRGWLDRDVHAKLTAGEPAQGDTPQRSTDAVRIEAIDGIEEWRGSGTGGTK